MKKIKLLTPIAGLVACATPLFATVSCGCSNDETEEEVVAFDEDVQKDYDIVADNDGQQHEIVIHNFKFKDDREIWGLSVELINQSSSLTKLSIEPKTEESEGGLWIDKENNMADVTVKADGIFDTETITFDLKFKNYRGQTFIATGFEINTKIIYWPEEYVSPYFSNVCATIDGKDHFFDSYQLCDAYLSNSEATYVMDIEGHRFKRSKFDGEIYVRNVEDVDGYPVLIGQREDGIKFEGFLSNMPNFNSPVHIGEGVKLTNRFLCDNPRFNSPVTFGSDVVVEFRGGDIVYLVEDNEVTFGFLANNKSFNQDLDLTNITSFYGTMLSYISRDIYILANCQNMVSEIKFNAEQIDYFSLFEYPQKYIKDYLYPSFALYNSNTPAYKQGMNITCVKKTMFDEYFPSLSGEYFSPKDVELYRKLNITEIAK